MQGGWTSSLGCWEASKVLSSGMLESHLIGSNIEGELEVRCDGDDGDKDEEGEENHHHQHHHHHQSGTRGQEFKSHAPLPVASDGSTQCKE